MSAGRDTLAAVMLWMCLMALLLLQGCASWFRARLPVHDRQAEAQRIVWEVYGRKEPPPTVYWTAPTCTSSTGKLGFGPSRGGGCLAGATYVPYAVTVVWVEGMTYSESGFAHEHLHAALMLDGMDDPDHLLSVWKAGGLLERANHALVLAGL